MELSTPQRPRLGTASWWPLLLGLAASLSVLLDMVLRGPLVWHFTRPEVVQGGLEALLLTVALMVLAYRGTRLAWAAAAAIAAFYLRRHHVDLPLLCAVATGEIFLAWGMLLLGSTRGEDRLWHGMKALVAGISLWLLAMLALHAFGLARAGLMLAMLLGGGLLTLLLRRRSELVLPALRAFSRESAWARAGWAALAGWMLVLMARSNSVIGFDTLWYPIRGSYVLAPNGSFFEPLGLVSPVHFAPKLWELLLLPWDAARDLSFMFGLGLLFLIGGLCVLATLLRRLGLPQSLLPPALLAIATLPALASTALQLKTDVAAWFFMLVALAAAARWEDRREPADLLWAFVGVALACCAKLTVLPYGGLLLAGLALAVWHRRRSTELRWKSVDVGSKAMLLVCFVIGGCLLYRTYLISGLPTIGPDPLVKLWNLMGMSLREPAGTLEWLRPQDWSDAPWLLPEALFAPNGLPNVRIHWTGNIWLVAGFVGLAWGSWRIASSNVDHTPLLRGLLWVTVAAGLLLLLAWRYHTRGSDGNYFIVPVSAACLLAFAWAGRAANAPSRILGLGLMLAACGFWQASLGFVTAGWSPPGTRTLDLDLSRSVRDTKRRLARERQSAGLAEVHQHLAALPAATRTVVASDSETAHLLPTRVESLEQVIFARPEYGASLEALGAYLKLACIEYFLVDARETRAQFVDLAGVVDRYPLAQLVLETDRWRLFSLQPACD